jgi:four helix bundle protein
MAKNIERKYYLEESTSKFGEDVIKYCKKIPRNPINDLPITQLVKAGTSVGANYSEADDAETKKDFRHKTGIVKKEARESNHFIRMTMITVPELEKEDEVLKQEAKELNLIFNSFFRKVKDEN